MTRILIKALYPLGVLWTSVWSLIGVLLLLTIYFPKRWPRWNHGGLEVVVRWSLIPKGFDRTGDGEINDPEDWYTGAQTHGVIKFFAGEGQIQRHDYHEQVHVWQCMIFGPLYGLIYGLDWLVQLLWLRDTAVAYEAIWFERWARRWQREFEDGKRRWL